MFLKLIVSRLKNWIHSDQPAAVQLPVQSASSPNPVYVVQQQKKHPFYKVLAVAMVLLVGAGVYEHQWNPLHWVHSPLPKSVHRTTVDGVILKTLKKAQALEVEEVGYKENMNHCDGWCDHKDIGWMFNKKAEFHAEGSVTVTFNLPAVKVQTDKTTNVINVTLPQPVVKKVAMNPFTSKQLKSNCGLINRLQSAISLIWGSVHSCNIDSQVFNQAASRQFEADAKSDEHMFNEARTQSETLIRALIAKIAPNRKVQVYWNGDDAPTKAADAGKKFVQGVLSGK